MLVRGWRGRDPANGGKPILLIRKMYVLNKAWVGLKNAGQFTGGNILAAVNLN